MSYLVLVLVCTVWHVITTCPRLPLIMASDSLFFLLHTPLTSNYHHLIQGHILLKKKNVCSARMFQLWRLCVVISCCSLYLSPALLCLRDEGVASGDSGAIRLLLSCPPSFHSFSACGGVLTWTVVFIFFASHILPMTHM
ncbi:hypothetical protein M404DRAFT_810703 [Pisolithus tinctorius Marx 270]|uniref:Uncharacterized protein n=1 Tax=Pisolithus tinctorius Marx 270 TaxID=870435 RepID=A0A0C3NEI6_PISTI|nr:hypothetical protein M404DRAFT_810703 [Pisolithus tinctorius Marx 270]